MRPDCQRRRAAYTTELERWFTFLFIFLLTLSHQIQVCDGCPKPCQCNWRNGKQWASCVNAKFIDIPRGLEPSTQVLNLQYNNLKILFTDAFHDTGLVNLQKIFLSHCQLRKLEKGSFRRIANLIELDLNSNYLTEVPSDALKDVSSIRELEMKENNLTNLEKDAFRTTPNLVLLDVSFNNITAIHDQAFRSLTRLEVLKISGNKISTITVNVLKPLVALHGFHVHFNPWKCDCILRPLRAWMIRKKIATSIPPKCHFPKRLKASTWKSLELNEFVCIPRVTAVASRIFVAHGENVSLACAVGNDPEVIVTWKLGDKLLNRETNYPQQRYKVLELILPEDEQQDHMKRLSNLTISEADLQDEGTYRCVVENKAGRVETNMTLSVSQVITEEPLVAVNEMFVAGAVLGALLFVLISVIVVSVILYKRGRSYDDDLLKLNSSSKVSLPLQHLCNDDDSETKSNKKFEYESIPTCDIVNVKETTASTDNKTNAKETKNKKESSVVKLEHSVVKINEDNRSSDRENILLNDLDKSDPESSVKSIANNILLEENISTYVEIPKAAQQTANNNFNQDQNPLLKNLAQQCRDEIMRRKCLKKSKREKSAHQFPDLLDFPKDSSLGLHQIPRRSSTSTDISSEALDEPRKNSCSPNSPEHSPFSDDQAVLFSHSLTSALYDRPGARRQSLTLPLSEAFDLEFHAAQLENFLQEYKNLQEQLFRMKESKTNIYAEQGLPVTKQTLLETEGMLEAASRNIPLASSTPCGSSNFTKTTPSLADLAVSDASSPATANSVLRPLSEDPKFFDELYNQSSLRSEPLKSILKTRGGDPLSPATPTTRASRGVFFNS